MRTARLAALLGLTLLSVGCMQVEYAIVLEEDLSGTSELEMTIDLEHLAYTTASIKAAFRGDGRPTDAQVEEARNELIEAIDSDDEYDAEEIRADIEPDLPDGMTLRYAEDRRDGLKQTIRLGFAFDHVDRLREFERYGAGEYGLHIKLDDSDVFEGLRFIERGDEIIVRGDPIEPIDELSDDPALPEQLVHNMLQDLRITLRLETPFDVLEHNATRQDGRTLTWVFDYDRLSRGEPAGIRARLKRR